jgi:hypothetical protein
MNSQRRKCMLKHTLLQSTPWTVNCLCRLCEDISRALSITILHIHYVSAPAPRAPAAPGYKLTPGLGYYKFHTTGKTWDGARRTCDQEGAHLAVINSEAEMNVLTSLFRSVPKLRGVAYNQYAYIGFHDRFSEGEYVTVIGKKTVYFLCPVFKQPLYENEIFSIHIQQNPMCQYTCTLYLEYIMEMVQRAGRNIELLVAYLIFIIM